MSSSPQLQLNVQFTRRSARDSICMICYATVRPASTEDLEAAQYNVRRSQGYSAPMIIEESRILQVSIFDTLQKNLTTVDYSLLLHDVMTIADECDSQLKQTIISFNKPPALSAV